MNGKERMNLAMRGEKPDRTPLMCQFSLGYLALHYAEDLIDFWYTPHGLAEAYIRAAEAHGFDGILVSRTGYDPGMRAQIASVENGKHGAKYLLMQDGARYYLPQNDYPLPQTLPHRDPRPSSIDEIDLEAVAASAREGRPWEFNILEEVLERRGKELSIHGEIGTAFERFLTLFERVDQGLMALLDDGPFAKKLIDELNRPLIASALEQCRLGVDAMKLSSPYAGAGFISREMYRQFVLPNERAIIRAVHEEHGLPCYIHTCGAIGDRLDLMLETETDGLECLDPPPLGTVDLAEASRQLGDRAFIKGNLDSVNELRNATAQEVLETARRRLEIGRRHPGGYILSTACSIAPDVPPENISVLRQAVCS